MKHVLAIAIAIMSPMARVMKTANPAVERQIPSLDCCVMVTGLKARLGLCLRSAGRPEYCKKGEMFMFCLFEMLQLVHVLICLCFINLKQLKKL